MSDVPTDLHREILLRLPAESLFRFRSVCKAWLGIINDPSFIKAHANYNQLYSQTLLVLKRPLSWLDSFRLDSLNFKTNGPQMMDATHIENSVDGGFPPRIREMSIAASCNGLIYIHDVCSKDDIRGIFNPLTKDFHGMPEPPCVHRTAYAFGFGYDFDSDDYKVVIIYFSWTGNMHPYWVYKTLIYSLKSDSWKMGDDSPGRIRYEGAFLDGTLYWASENGITAFDLGTERYCQLPLPPSVIPPYDDGISLVSLDGCLICSLNCCEKKTFDGWMMKEKSWIKLFTLQYPAVLKFRGLINAPVELKLVALKRNEQVLLHHYLHGFLWFDMKSNSIKEISIHGLDSFSFLICPGSLVRLNDYLGKDIIKVQWKPINTKITNTRLELCVRNVGDMCNSDDSCWHYKD